MRQLQLVSPSPSCSIVILVVKQRPGIYFTFFSLLSAEAAKSTTRQVFIFFLAITRSGRLTEIRWFFLYLKIPEHFVRLILQDWFRVVHLPFIRMIKFKYLAQFPVDPFPHRVVSSFIVFYASLLHPLIMWLIVSSLSSHNIHLLFCCVLPIFALT